MYNLSVSLSYLFLIYTPDCFNRLSCPVMAASLEAVLIEVVFAYLLLLALLRSDRLATVVLLSGSDALLNDAIIGNGLNFLDIF